MNIKMYRLMEYCRRCGVMVDERETVEEIGNELLTAIIKSIENNKNCNHIFMVSPTSDIESLSNEIFINKLRLG